MGQRHVCTFRHALRAAYRTAISAAQILVVHAFVWVAQMAVGKGVYKRFGKVGFLHVCKLGKAKYY